MIDHRRQGHALQTRPCAVNLGVIATLLAAIWTTGAGGSVLYVDDDAPAGGDGLSWETAFRFLQDGLVAAGESEGEVSEIRVGQGTYQPDQDEGSPEGSGDREAALQLINGVMVLGGYAGLGAPDPDERDIALYETILTGDIGIAGESGDNSYHVVTGSLTEASAVLDGVTITAGRADGEETWSRGGGMYNETGSPTVINCLFSGNAAACGGGMCNDGSNPWVSGCEFVGNSAEHEGGGMYNETGSPLVINCVFSGNTGASGGGMCNDGSSPTVSGCEFVENSADDKGGGMCNHEGSDATVAACSFIANTSGGNGGGMRNEYNMPSISGCTFVGNTSEGSGGAISNTDGEPSLLDCVFADNFSVSSHGGAMYSASGASTVVRCAFSGNAGVSGGAIGSGCSGYDLTVAECTFSNNQASNTGGAMHCQGGSITLSACSFDGNDAADDGGAVHACGTGELDFDGCAFDANEAAERGGAVCAVVPMTMTDCSFFGNAAEIGGAVGLSTGVGATKLSGCGFLANTATDGGAVHLRPGDGKDFNATDCTFLLNTATRYGGAMYCDGQFSDRKFILAECLLEQNEADTGGGVYTWEGRPQIVGCTFRGNSATDEEAGDGGAIHNHKCEEVLIVGSVFCGNTAVEHGGGISGYLGGQTTLINCLFHDNASERGGGVYGFFENMLTVADCTFAENVAGEGGCAVYGDYYSPALANCIAWSSGGSAASQLEGPVTVRYSCIEGGYEGEGNIDADPVFLDPEGDDYRLSPASPCIDAGDNTAVPADVDTDLDGNPRFVDNPDTEDTGFGEPPIVDMGAYEFQLGPCLGDINGDGVVDVTDLLYVLALWGESGGIADVNGDGIVDVLDLVVVLSAWGPCR